MPDWVVREFCRPAIWFQDHKFFLLAKERVSGRFRWKYSLGVAPVDDRQFPPYSIVYSEEYVASRQQAYRRAVASNSFSALLRPLFPVLGFCWSGTKDHLERFGFPARSITSASVAVEFGAFMVLGIFTGYLGYWSGQNLLALVILAADLLMRYDAVLSDHPRQFGFLEWCFRRRN